MNRGDEFPDFDDDDPVMDFLSEPSGHTSRGFDSGDVRSGDESGKKRKSSPSQKRRPAADREDRDDDRGGSRKPKRHPAKSGGSKGKSGSGRSKQIGSSGASSKRRSSGGGKSRPARGRSRDDHDEFDERAARAEEARRQEDFETNGSAHLSDRDMESGQQMLDAEDENSLYIGRQQKIQFYRRRPKRGIRERIIYLSHMTALILLPIVLVFFLVGSWQNHGLKNQLNAQREESYNPALRERNADAGKATIYAYYNHSVPPVSLAKNLSWPGSTDSSATFSEDDLSEESGDSESLGGYDDFGDDDDSGDDSGTVGADADVLAIVKNLYLASSSVEWRDGTDAEVRSDPAMERVEVETLIYRGSYNGMDKGIAVKILTPMSKSVTELTAADNLQPPILVSLPTVLEPRATVTGAPGTTDPGTQGGSLKPIKRLPEQVKTSIEDWADSYAADDRSGLRSIVADPRDRNFVGMTGGWTLKDDPKVEWQYVRSSDNLMVVGVTFTATQTVKIDGSDVPMITDQPQTMELLIDYSNGGTPAVVAWGPSGSAVHLKKFQNAVRDNEVPDAAKEDSSSGSSSSSGGTASIPGNADDKDEDSSTAEIDGNSDDGKDSSSSSSSDDKDEDDFF